MFYKDSPLGDKQNLKSRDSKHGSAVLQKVRFCIELVNITFKQGTLGLNKMYLQILVNVV